MATEETRIASCVVRATGLPDHALIGLNEDLFGGSLGLDSIDALSIIVELEQEFDISIDEAHAKDGLKTLASIAAMIEELTPKAANG